MRVPALLWAFGIAPIAVLLFGSLAGCACTRFVYPVADYYAKIPGSSALLCAGMFLYGCAPCIRFCCRLLLRWLYFSEAAGTGVPLVAAFFSM